MVLRRIHLILPQEGIWVSGYYSGPVTIEHDKLCQ